MLPDLKKPVLTAALLAAALGAAPALADVKAGVDAWSRGDYAVAVREWEGPAAAGDADAMFNLGQAYRLGRGVAMDLKRAEALYARAAAAGHLQAADTYGLLLFQDGRREAAMPYVEASAKRGDPRAQYLLGVALFNGDGVSRDWVRAYALLTLANGEGLPQAAPAIAEMDQVIPLTQRQQAAALAVRLRNEADATRQRELAAAELGAPVPVAPGPTSATALPRPIPTVAVSPSVAAARAAVAEAARATGTESPAEAGAIFARSGSDVQVAAVPPPATAVVVRSEQAPAPAQVTRAAAAGGPWRVQLGAFSVASNANALWNRLSGRSELAGAERLLIPAGAVTKLQAGGFANRAAADSACRALKQAGQDCLVTQR